MVHVIPEVVGITGILFQSRQLTLAPKLIDHNTSLRTAHVGMYIDHFKGMMYILSLGSILISQFFFNSSVFLIYIVALLEDSEPGLARHFPIGGIPVHVCGTDLGF